ALLGRGVKAMFAERFPDAYKPKRGRGRSAAAPPTAEGEELATSEYPPILEWVASGHHVSSSDDMPQAEYARQPATVQGRDRRSGRARGASPRVPPPGPTASGRRRWWSPGRASRSRTGARRRRRAPTRASAPPGCGGPPRACRMRRRGRWWWPVDTVARGPA